MSEVWSWERKYLLARARDRYKGLLEAWEQSHLPKDERALYLLCMQADELRKSHSVLEQRKDAVEKYVAVGEEFEAVEKKIAVSKRDMTKGVPKHLTEKRDNLVLELRLADHSQLAAGWLLDEVEERIKQLETLIIHYRPESAKEFGIHEVALPLKGGKYKIKVPKDAKKVHVKV